MEFGKEFSMHIEEALPKWRDKFLCYKPLKKLLKHVSTAIADHPYLPIDVNVDDSESRMPSLEDDW